MVSHFPGAFERGKKMLTPYVLGFGCTVVSAAGVTHNPGDNWGRDSGVVSVRIFCLGSVLALFIVLSRPSKSS